MLPHAILVVLVFFDTLTCITGSCGGGTTSLYYSGRFNVPLYSNGMKCSWRLHSRQGERVFLTFTSFSTEPVYDYVEIRDTANSSHVIGRFSGSQIPPVVVSCSSTVTVTFVSDRSATENGFAASFESRGDIVSSRFPSYYSNGQEQRWVICAFQNYPLCMRFTDFNTEESFDFVNIATNTESVIGKYSGSSLPPTVRVSLNTFVNFTSDGSVTDKGFRAEFCPSSCPTLTSPQNGRFSSSLYIVNARVELLCNPGYQKVGTTSVTCQVSGTWSDTIGRCQRTSTGTSCSAPPDVPNGRLVGTRYHVGDEVTLICSPGYYVAGGKNRFRCSSAGVWSDRARMACYAVSCDKPATPENGRVTGGYYFGDSVTFTCNAGYKVQGPSSATCLASGQWNQQPPTCQDALDDLSSEERELIRQFQEDFFDPYRTFTKEAMPPPDSSGRSATYHDDSILALDLIFVLDTSGSVGSQNFAHVKKLVNRMANAFNFGKDSTYMGAIAFGTVVYDISPLTSSPREFVKKVTDFQYKSGGTNTTGALLEAKNMFLSSPRNVERLKRVLILVTDGHSNTHKTKPADMVGQLASHSIERYVFSIGTHTNINEIRAIASPPSDRHVFNVSSFKVFAKFAEFVKPKKITNDCGIAGAPGFHPRVINGKHSAYGAWPWLASIYIRGPGSNDPFQLRCGGTLVSKRWVITAAHCVYRYHYNKKLIQVKLGDHYRNIKDLHEETFELDDNEDIVFGGNGHAKVYHPQRANNDIALMKLNRDVNFNSFVRPICLLKSRYHDVNLTTPGSRATVVGWGLYTEQSSSPSLVPREITVSILENTRCNKQTIGQSLTENMICAKGTKTDACIGDSGGPLMCQAEDNRFSLCGIVSFGKDSKCNPDGYGGYTRTFKFMDTIRSKITTTR